MAKKSLLSKKETPKKEKAPKKEAAQKEALAKSVVAAFDAKELARNAALEQAEKKDPVSYTHLTLPTNREV